MFTIIIILSFSILNISEFLNVGVFFYYNFKLIFHVKDTLSEALAFFVY